MRHARSRALVAFLVRAGCTRFASLAELAEAAGVNVDHLGRVMRSERAITLDLLDALSRATDLPRQVVRAALLAVRALSRAGGSR